MKWSMLWALLLAGSAAAQSALVVPKPVESMYVKGSPIDFAVLVPAPPADNSAAGRADLAAVHRVEAERTVMQVRAAQADDANETIFLFSDVLGPKFRPEALPLTAAFSIHLRRESSVINPALKRRFARLRPYRADKTLHLVCAPSEAAAYPSGHAMVGYLLGFALTQMVPEDSDAILARSRQFAENRIVCGAHYPTDIEASRAVSLALFGEIAGSPVFRAELAAARAETRRALGLPPIGE